MPYSDIVQEEMIRNGSAQDWVHGLLHVERVLENWQWLVCSSEKIDPRLARLLQVAGYFHDVKKHDVGRFRNHAEASAAFFLDQDLAEITEEEKADIAFAIRYHNVGLQKLGLRADCRRHVLLALLCVIDGMDSACYVGYYRVLGWYGQKGESFDLFGKYSARELERLLETELSDAELDGLKDSGALLPHLIFNLRIFRSVLEPVMDLLGVDFLIETERRMRTLREEIKRMIELKTKNERPLRFFGN